MELGLSSRARSRERQRPPVLLRRETLKTCHAAARYCDDHFDHSSTTQRGAFDLAFSSARLFTSSSRTGRKWKTSFAHASAMYRLSSSSKARPIGPLNDVFLI